MKDLVVKDLVEYAIAEAAGRYFESDLAEGEWKPFDNNERIGVIKSLCANGHIRIKPNKTYYRVYKRSQLNMTAESASPLPDAGEWFAIMARSENKKVSIYELVKDFEIEEPLTVTEEITLYEHTTDSGGTRWLKTPACKSETGRIITAVIKGDES